MKSITHLAVVAFAALQAGIVAAVPTISAKGAKFFTSDGNQYFVKGIAYQLTPDDPLINAEQCSLDASLMKTLGANAIRVYHVDPRADHTSCMATFADAGIYLFVDLDTFTTQIEPAAPHWNQTQYDAFAAVMDEFQKYDNTAGFFVGNEVLTTGNNSIAAPFVKAAARDMKAYRDNKGYRKIPVGYSAADISSLRPNLQNYLACGTNTSEALDFFSLNAYEWCGSSTYSTSGYSDLQKNASSYNIPIFFSETGCNTPAPRTFEDQAAIFGDEMSGTWSGAIIYEWIQEANNYGLISYGPTVAATATASNVMDGFSRAGTPTPISPDFSNLSKQWKTLSPSGVSESAYQPTVTAPPCPSYTSAMWEVNGGVSLPSLGQTYDASVASSITAGTAGTAAASGNAAASTSSGVAMPQRRVSGASAGLTGLLLTLLGFF
ncbi:1,3-beta-glucanosyltransferase [Sphaceloma murrayae]|uniref:1,3-beta-glucanosyltransferase n=1 Tax=Sphaceloma murrayae TaxID=2082308 RepID=A0A2K1QYI1_9PEZI|nr:1,3-beta-glucanosyltransferase [Sphaceloma murrayae]